MRGKLILIAGMYRSGSTWLYNATRMFSEEYFGRDNVYSCFVTDYNPEDPRGIHIVKMHEYYENLAHEANLIVLSERDFSEIAMSMSKFHDIDYTPQEMEVLCSYYSEFLNHETKSVIFRYNEIVNMVGDELVGKSHAMLRLVLRMHETGILDQMNISEYQVSEFVKKVEALPIPEGTPDYADPITLLHPKHRRKTNEENR